MSIAFLHNFIFSELMLVHCKVEIFFFYSILQEDFVIEKALLEQLLFIELLAVKVIISLECLLLKLSYVIVYCKRFFSAQISRSRNTSEPFNPHRMVLRLSLSETDLYVLHLLSQPIFGL